MIITVVLIVGVSSLFHAPQFSSDDPFDYNAHNNPAIVSLPAIAAITASWAFLHEPLQFVYPFPAKTNEGTLKAQVCAHLRDLEGYFHKFDKCFAKGDSHLLALQLEPLNPANVSFLAMPHKVQVQFKETSSRRVSQAVISVPIHAYAKEFASSPEVTRVCVLGKTGAGKSTLGNSFATSLRPTKGKVNLFTTASLAGSLTQGVKSHQISTQNDQRNSVNLPILVSDFEGFDTNSAPTLEMITMLTSGRVPLDIEQMLFTNDAEIEARLRRLNLFGVPSPDPNHVCHVNLLLMTSECTSQTQTFQRQRINHLLKLPIPLFVVITQAQSNALGMERVRNATNPAHKESLGLLKDQVFFAPMVTGDFDAQDMINRKFILELFRTARLQALGLKANTRTFHSSRPESQDEQRGFLSLLVTTMLSFSAVGALFLYLVRPSDRNRCSLSQRTFEKGLAVIFCLLFLSALLNKYA